MRGACRLHGPLRCALAIVLLILDLLCTCASLAADPTVVTDLKIVRGATRAEAQEACAAMCPCRDALTKHVTSNWFMVGDNLGTGQDNSIHGPAFVYLCMRQDRRSAVAKDGAALFAVQSIVAIEKPSPRCPSSMLPLFTPRRDLVVCTQLAPVKFALATGMYVSDVGAVNPSMIQATSVGWTSVPISARMSEVDEEKTSPPVYIQYKRPVQPIVGVQMLTDVDPMTSGGTACRKRLDAKWEDVGGGFIHAETGARSVLCVERMKDPEGGDDGRNASHRPVLTHVKVITLTDNCPNAQDQQVVVLSTKWKACLGYTRGSTKAAYINHVMLASRWEMMQGQEWPPDLTQVTTADLNDGHSKISTVMFVQRSAAPYRALRQQATKKKAAPVIPLSSRPMLQARMHDVLSTGHITSHLRLRTNSALATTPVAVLPQQLTFKILQLADLHLTGDPDHYCKNPPTEYALCGMRCTENLTVAFVNDLLDAEQPDLVVFSGDTITVREWELKEPAIAAALTPVEQRGIPYAWIMGNHDDDWVYNRNEIMDKLVRRKLAYVESGPSTVHGVGNYELNVVAAADGPWGATGDTVFRIYFLDSNKLRDTTLFPNIKSTYDWIRPDQIAFYRNISEQHRAAAASGESLPAIMFFHIPIPEYSASGPSYARHGAKHEKTEGPKFNSGLFDMLVERHDVKATFAGHDHTNEYCFKQKGVQLCYGGGTGFGAAIGSSAVARRARVIEWSVDAQNRRQLKSWKRHFGRKFPHRQREEILYSEP